MCTACKRADEKYFSSTVQSTSQTVLHNTVLYNIAQQETITAADPFYRHFATSESIAFEYNFKLR